jgi:RNA polymerase sigma factor (sigma-70 family)
VQRHGPMVLKVCRQVVGDWHDGEDAFQATFLVLLRKADSVRDADSVASWLHGVAYRVSRRAKAEVIRRRAREQRVAEMTALRHDEKANRPESWTELHEEIARLPARYREPLVLCYLEGLTTGAVAQRLRCPQGTVLSRLSRGREQLRARLTRRGLAPAGSLAPGSMSLDAETARVPGGLLSATVHIGTRFLDGSAAAERVSASVASLTEGVLQAMFWTKMQVSGLVGLALAVLAFGAGAALAYQEKAERRVLLSQNARQEPTRPPVKTLDPPKPRVSSAAAFVPLPPRGELQQLLRRASNEAIALAKANPKPSSWCLTTIATAQAKAGDLEGARATFAEASREAEGGGPYVTPRNLWRIGHSQGECGLTIEAGLSLQRAVKAMPGVVSEYEKNSFTLRTLVSVAQDQAKLRAREDARKTVERLLDFSSKFFETSKIRNARVVSAPDIAASLAAVGDFDAAFRWTERIENGGIGLGKIAETAADTLDREAARKFVREAAERLAKLNLAEEKYFGLGNLAKAQARLGDLDGAKRSAKAIGEGPSGVGYDTTDGQPYALVRVAWVQREAGDTAGAKDTLREAFRTVNEHPQMRHRDGRFLQIALGQTANGDIEGVVQTVNAMEEQRSEILASLARAYAALGDEKAARTTFVRALIDAKRTANNPPSPNPELAKMPGVSQNMSASALMGLAKIQAMSGDIPGALKTGRSIDDLNYRRSALQSVVAARATAGDVAGALRLCLDETKTQEERRSALEGLGRGVDDHLSLKLSTRRAE